MDIFKLGGIDVFALFGFFIEETPENHPYETEGTDDDECHFPSEMFCERRDAEGSCESTY